MAKKERKSNKKKNGTLFATAVVILGLLVITIVFLAKKDQIVSNLKETNFFERVTGSTPDFVKKHESSKKQENEIENDVVVLKTEQKTDIKEDEQPVIEQIKNDVKEEAKQEEAKKEEIKKPEQKKEEIQKKDTKKEEQKKPEQKTSNIELQICFVEIDSDGSVVRKIVKRSVKKNDSPLATSLALLLEGPDSRITAERNCMTLIPEGTKLLSAKVQNGVAYLNFNENFEFNSYGVEGYIGQLMQIVYTATSFSTVNSVQFLIDGEKRDYLGSEGQWIGSPLSRNSF